MASLQEIKLRIRSVKSTKKITKAMEMIAASKMRRAQNQALKGRPYLEKLTQVIGNLVYLSTPRLQHPFLKNKKRVKRIGYIFLTSNRGLCGGFNSNIIRTMVEILSERNDKEEIVIAVGRKGRQAMERVGKTVLADFENIPDKPEFLDTVGISRIVMDNFLKTSPQERFDEVWLVYNHFYSTIQQKPLVKKLLPVKPVRPDAKNKDLDYIFDTKNKEELLDALLKRYIQTSVYQTILESIASEQSARMMAMRQASDNAQEIVANLTLHYNKARQNKITNQLLEIVGGAG